MNILIACNRHCKKFLSTFNYKGHNHRVLKYVTNIDKSFRSTIFQTLPHIIVIFKDTKSQCSVIDEITALLDVMKNIRIIYIYGEVKSRDEFLHDVRQLSNIGVYDIVFDTVPSSKEFEKRFFDILDNPLTLDDISAIIADCEAKKEQEANVDILVNKIAVNKQDDNTRALLFNYQGSTTGVSVVTEKDEFLYNEKYIIAVAPATPMSDASQTAIEITAYLHTLGVGAALYLNDIIYEQLRSFTGMTSSATFLYQGIEILPLSAYSSAMINNQYTVLSLDSFSNDYFVKSSVKIMVCYGTDPNACDLQKYVNRNEFSREVNFCYYPISQKNFLKYNKAMQRASLKAYRLCTSPLAASPCRWNTNVYRDILSRYATLPIKKESRWKLWGWRL